jgi:hypothetical protein
MAETRKIVGCYNADGISTESFVKEITSWIGNTYSITTETLNEEESRTSHGITRFPCFIMIKNGSVFSRKQGKYVRKDYQQWLENYSWDS